MKTIDLNDKAIEVIESLMISSIHVCLTWQEEDETYPPLELKWRRYKKQLLPMLTSEFAPEFLTQDFSAPDWDEEDPFGLGYSEIAGNRIKAYYSDESEFKACKKRVAALYREEVSEDFYQRAANVILSGSAGKQAAGRLREALDTPVETKKAYMAMAVACCGFQSEIIGLRKTEQAAQQAIQNWLASGRGDRGQNHHSYEVFEIDMDS